MMTGAVVLKRGEPAHDPEALRRVAEIWGKGLRRGLLKRNQVLPTKKAKAEGASH